jgi:cyclopropane-fatty-acyl-phospholipid synthase
VLGGHRKYSCCHWSDGTRTLDEAEAESLRITCARAGIGDGMDVLELGCGWGSLTLWMARRHPRSRITAVSNSGPQREFIMDIARREGLDNVRVITADMNEFKTEAQFDRVVSIEMFEHMRNYETLLERIARWLRPDGRLFVHVFAHRSVPYAFETDGSSNWMGRYFFTGGIMPTPDLFGRFGHHLQVDRQWWWDGTHYERTANAWVRNLDARRREVMPILVDTYGPRDADRWFHRWRMFFLACAELFGDRGGEEWGVCHTLLAPVAKTAKRAADPALAEVA